MIVHADANAYPGRPETNARVRAIIPITIAAALDVTLARRIVI
jgi:hypothetical protein